MTEHSTVLQAAIKKETVGPGADLTTSCADLFFATAILADKSATERSIMRA